jgi:hypothetical protein
MPGGGTARRRPRKSKQCSCTPRRRRCRRFRSTIYPYDCVCADGSRVQVDCRRSAAHEPSTRLAAAWHSSVVGLLVEIDSCRANEINDDEKKCSGNKQMNKKTRARSQSIKWRTCSPQMPVTSELPPAPAGPRGCAEATTGAGRTAPQACCVAPTPSTVEVETALLLPAVV